MSCNCLKTIKTVSVIADATSVTYTIPEDTVINENGAYNIIFCQELPPETTLQAKVIIANGKKKFIVLTRKASFLKAENIINARGIRVWLGEEAMVLRNFILAKK